MAEGRVTKSGSYVELGGAGLQVTQAGAYVEIGEPDSISVAVTQAGAYVEISNAADRVTQVGAYVEIVTEGRVTQAGVYVEILLPTPPKPAVNRKPHFYAQLQTPDFNELINPSFGLKPMRWSWKRPGGCYRAEIDVIGTEKNTWQTLPSLLRSPVKIYNNNKTAVWWGYVHAVELSAPDAIIGASLDGLFNRVALTYTLVTVGGSTGVPSNATYVQDDDSINRFGKKELIVNYGEASTAQAEAVRDATLAQRRYILPDVRAGNGKSSAKLICYGWWDSLDFELREHSYTANQTIAYQIGVLVADQAQFLAGLDQLAAHDISSNEWRDGSQTSKQVMEELLLVPMSTGERITAYITRERLMRVDYEGVSGETDWLLMPNNQFRSFLGAVPEPGSEIIGWTQLRGVLPAANWGYMSAPSPLYIQENEFDAERLEYNWRARGAISAWG